MEKTDMAIQEYRKAVDLQQGYVTAWNNLGDAYEKSKQWRCVTSSIKQHFADLDMQTSCCADAN